MLSTIVRFSLSLGLLQTLAWEKVDEICQDPSCEKMRGQACNPRGERIIERNFTSNSRRRDFLMCQSDLQMPAVNQRHPLVSRSE